jgi:hypothetical protein
MSDSKSETRPGFLTTGVPWLDNAVAKSDVPPVFDTGGANMFYGQISGNTLSDEYFQRLPIRYRRIGRTRVYDFDDIVAYVKMLRVEAPRKTPAPRKRRRRRQPEPA